MKSYILYLLFIVIITEYIIIFVHNLKTLLSN